MNGGISEDNALAQYGHGCLKKALDTEKALEDSNRRFDMVPRAGFEPTRLSALPPQDSASTNFATWAEGRHCSS
jgi:hypothetical protein